MAAKKKMKKRKQLKLKRTAGKKMKPMKGNKKPAMKKAISKKGSARKSAKKRAVVRAKSETRKGIGAHGGTDVKKPVRPRSQSVNRMASPSGDLAAYSGLQSGDLQGLSNIERADSESVDELLEEGNAFEADVVRGVERAGDADESEVHTHEVPEDDVPDEYLDKE